MAIREQRYESKAPVLLIPQPVDLYQARKTHQLGILEHQLKLISYKVKFILMVVEKKLEVNNKKRVEIEEKLETKNGQMPVPQGVGIGVTLDWEFLETVTLSKEIFKA